MQKSPHDLAQSVFQHTFAELSAAEQALVQRLSHRQPISRNTNAEFDDQLTLGQRVADRVAAFGGSWSFILIFLSVLVSWIAFNTLVLGRFGAAFDPYPFILLNLVLSMIAALQAPVIMMSQNRQAAKDRMDAAHDYAVNLKAELEIAALHQKIDLLREQQWAELVALQQDQIALLTRILEQQRPTTQGNRPPTDA